MDIDEAKIGQWPNIAINPRTGRHAATGEEIERGGQMTDNQTTAKKWAIVPLTFNRMREKHDRKKALRFRINHRTQQAIALQEEGGGAMSEQDTREKLEADVRKTLTDPDDWHAWVQYHTALKWLNRQAAITERECHEGIGSRANSICDELHKRIAELEAEVDSLRNQLTETQRAYKERGRIIAELREQLRNDDEPFCETVKRWLSDDAPEECLECEDGCWREMHELMARECDECEPMLAAEREILELKAFCERIEKAVGNCDDLTLYGVDYVPAETLEDEKAENGWAREFLNRIGPKCGKPDCPSLVAYVEQLEAERDRLQGVVMQQAESFRGMEQELKAALAEKDGKHGKRKLPKPVKWPRDANGKLVGFGYGGASSITFTRYGYCVDYGDGTAVSGRYGEEVRA